MKRRLVAATASSLLLLSTSAFADSLSGLYVGANGAISENFETDFAVTNGVSANLSATDTLSSADAVIGYNAVTSDSLFFGGEVFYTMGGAKDETLNSGDGSAIEIEKENGFGVVGKLGLAITETSAVYGILGYGRSEAKLSVTGEIDGVQGSDTDDFSGYIMGVGSVFSLSNNLLISVEGKYADYDDENYALDGGENLSFDPQEMRVTAGLAYRFDI